MDETPIIVSRHAAAIEFIHREAPHTAESTVIAQATPADVLGKVVYGNLPLSLASLADRVVAIEFSGEPPRGAEYTLADMDAAGARLECYKVMSGSNIGITEAFASLGEKAMKAMS